MIVDSLTHVTPDGRWFNTTYDASESRLLREMDAAGVDRAVVVALAGFIANEFVQQVCNRHAGRLIAGASFDPGAYESGTVAAAEFRSQLLGSPFRVLKLHPRLNGYDPLDSRCLAILEELASWKTPMPVWLDTIFYYRRGNLRKSPVDAIHEIVCRFPDLNFVLLHAGGTMPLQVTEAVRDCPNAFVDLSLVLCRYADTSLALDFRFLISRFDRRTVCGSDFPEYVMNDVLDEFQRAAGEATAEKCDNILGRNLATLLSL